MTQAVQQLSGWGRHVWEIDGSIAFLHGIMVTRESLLFKTCCKLTCRAVRSAYH